MALAAALVQAEAAEDARARAAGICRRPEDEERRQELTAWLRADARRHAPGPAGRGGRLYLVLNFRKSGLRTSRAPPRLLHSCINEEGGGGRMYRLFMFIQ